MEIFQNESFTFKRLLINKVSFQSDLYIYILIEMILSKLSIVRKYAMVLKYFLDYKLVLVHKLQL